MPLALENQIADLPPWVHVAPNPKHKPSAALEIAPSPGHEKAGPEKG